MISIHVPAWGTTQCQFSSESPFPFQSTFPRGERLVETMIIQKVENFNPRSRVGNDIPPFHVCPPSVISIHVPAWGTTAGISGRHFAPCSHFNPRSRVGNDASPTPITDAALFQSTFPRGERPHTPVTVFLMFVFQSTFPRGERRKLQQLCLMYWLFQSTFPRGERQCVVVRRCCFLYFNPRSRVGNDHTETTIYLHSCDFNPRSRVGNDVIESAGNIGLKLISIHVPAWGTTAFLSLFVFYDTISIHVPAWGTTANFHKYSLFFYAINIIFLLFIIPSLFSLVLFMLLF